MITLCGCCKSSRQMLVLIVRMHSSNARSSVVCDPGTNAAGSAFADFCFGTSGKIPSMGAPSLYSTSSVLLMVRLEVSRNNATAIEAEADSRSVSSVINTFFGLIGSRGVSAYSTIWALVVPVLSASTTSLFRM